MLRDPLKQRPTTVNPLATPGQKSGQPDASTVLINKDVAGDIDVTTSRLSTGANRHLQIRTELINDVEPYRTRAGEIVLPATFLVIYISLVKRRRQALLRAKACHGLPLEVQGLRATEGYASVPDIHEQRAVR